MKTTATVLDETGLSFDRAILANLLKFEFLVVDEESLDRDKQVFLRVTLDTRNR